MRRVCAFPKASSDAASAPNDGTVSYVLDAAVLDGGRHKEEVSDRAHLKSLISCLRMWVLMGGTFFKA